MDWKIVAMTFALVFVAEFGDKTQLIVFARSAETGAPISVLVGASAALIVCTGIGVLVGGAVGKLPDWTVKGVAGLVFLGIGVWTLLSLRK